MLEALKSLSEFFKENNLRSRRNLRGDIEKRSLAINEDFVQSFTAVKEVSKANLILSCGFRMSDFVIIGYMRVLKNERSNDGYICFEII